MSRAKTRRTCENLLKHEISLWTFVREAGVEPTNNDAERPLRRAVLWRRKSFGTQSESGQPIRGADIDGGHEPAATRAGCAGISDLSLCCTHSGEWLDLTFSLIPES